jgi:ribosome-associated toxin RatA of RatAB toxin-antitoxin module
VRTCYRTVTSAARPVLRGCYHGGDCDVRGPTQNIQMPLAPFLVLVSLAQAVGGGWTAAGTKDGVTLAFRDDPQLEVREVRATSELSFPAARIFSLVCDFTHYGSLVSGVQETRMISGTAPSNYEIYVRYAPRFLVVAARDVVVQVQGQSTPGGSSRCEWIDLKQREPERKGAVRIPLLRGSWTVEPLDATRSRVVYQVAVNPGGRLPGWLVRRGAVSALPEVIEQVRKRLGRESDAPSR